MTRFSIDLLDSESEISKAIMVALQQHFSRSFSGISNQIANPIKEIVKQALRAEPEYTSLKSGKLRYEMGIEDVSSVDTVIDAMVNTLNIQSTPITYSSTSLSGGFTLTMIKSDDIGGVINTQAAQVNDTIRGYSLPWLEWLLLRGNDIIVYNYQVKIGPNPRSRTGNAIMVSANQNWRVPTEFVGTEKNNWTTRAISAAESSIVDIIEQAIKDML